MNTINEIRKSAPLIHNLTNNVVMNFTANGLLAFGAIPIMAKEKMEVAQMAQMADAVLINIGTLLTTELESMIIAGKAANSKGIPVVLDPVGVAATTFRGQATRALLTEVQFTAIKGNSGEMAHLINIEVETRGTESNDADEALLIEIAQKVANKYQTIAVITGETDVICHTDIVKTNKTGHINLTKITGAGCLLGAIIAAGLTTTGPSPLDKVFDVVRFYGQAAENAMQYPEVAGTGSFLPRFIDELGGVSK